MSTKERLQKAMGTTSQYALAKLSGVPQPTINRILGGNSPKVETLEKLALALGVKASWLAVGEDTPMPALSSSTQLQIPILDVEASGGMGFLNGTELVNDHMTVEKSYLGEFGLPTDNLKIITIRGDSMEPELTTGDLVLVHHVTIPMEKMHDGMFVVLIDDLLFIKRLQRLPGKRIKVISSNRDAYDPFTVDAVDLSIIGRVVFAWRGKKF